MNPLLILHHLLVTRMDNYLIHWFNALQRTRSERSVVEKYAHKESSFNDEEVKITTLFLSLNNNEKRCLKVES